MFFSRPVGNKYIDRGDPEFLDWTTENFTTDDFWHDLDCSNIVPKNTIAIMFTGRILHSESGKQFMMRKNGNTYYNNQRLTRTQVANIAKSFNWIVACDSDRLVEYRASNTTFLYIDLTIAGWFVK